MEKKEKKQVNAGATQVAQVLNPTNEALQLQKEIERKEQELQRCLDELNRKKELSERRIKFIDAAKRLDEHFAKLQEDTDFETQESCLRLFSTAKPYRIDETCILSISNTEIILEVITFLNGKIQTKIEQLERDLVA